MKGYLPQLLRMQHLEPGWPKLLHSRVTVKQGPRISSFSQPFVDGQPNPNAVVHQPSSSTPRLQAEEDREACDVTHPVEKIPSPTPTSR